MKVLHIIPNAFDYFEDVRHEAFEILEKESELGIDADAITLDYGTITRKEKTETKIVAPSQQYLGQQPIETNVDVWQNYDIINLHCPFFGAGGKILEWIKNHPDKFLILTYHRDFKTTDFFGYIIKYYNYYYLPKLFKLATWALFFGDRRGKSDVGLKIFTDDKKIVILGSFEQNIDIHRDAIVSDLIMVYNTITSK